GVNRRRMHDLETLLARGRDTWQSNAPPGEGPFPVQEMEIPGPAGPIPVLVQLPPAYRPNSAWPLMFAMHGGPVGKAADARRAAGRMLAVWQEAAGKAGWIVAAPAMLDTVAAGPFTRERLPYEIFHPEEARAVLLELRSRFAIDPDRIVSTGISLGSNFSIAYACAHPDWFSAIVPVSTEGDSRELLLRNLRGVPVFLLEGSRDQNIRTIAGPRAFRDILKDFGYELEYREFSDRVHEGFQERYPEVLKWLGERPRKRDPHVALRVPNSGIVALSRRIHWAACDTRQGLFRAETSDTNRIEIAARWTRRIELFLNDRLVDLDRPVEVAVNGRTVFQGRVPRSIPFALAQIRELGDESRVYPARLEVEVPDSPSSLVAARQLWHEYAPRREEGTLSYWETFATRALFERFPSAGFQGVEQPLPQGVPGSLEQVALRVESVESGSAVALAGLRPGDLVLEFGGEPFFHKHTGVAGLHQLLLRELRGRPSDHLVRVWRDGKILEWTIRLQLGSYRETSSR
ncbi:MAG: hypothetical protein ACE5H3_06490, partial [Planctomycetota bacterium]